MKQIESLEVRRMFAVADASASVAFSDGTLTVRGTAAAERVYFETNTRTRRDANGEKRSIETLTVNVVQSSDGQTLASATFETRKLKNVVATLGGGADKFKVPNLYFFATIDGKSQPVTRTIRYSVDGGSGNDTLTGGAASDQLIGGKGDDSIVGGLGNDQLYGGDGNDTIFAGFGNDTVFGQGGDDLLYDDGSYVNANRHPAQYAKDSGKDVFHGGSGRDTLWAAGRLNANSAVEVRRNPGSPENDVPLTTD